MLLLLTPLLEEWALSICGDGGAGGTPGIGGGDVIAAMAA
jgi:hypothetical protein